MTPRSDDGCDTDRLVSITDAGAGSATSLPANWEASRLYFRIGVVTLDQINPGLPRHYTLQLIQDFPRLGLFLAIELGTREKDMISPYEPKI